MVEECKRSQFCGFCAPLLLACNSESHIHDLEVCIVDICEDARSQGNLNLNRGGLTFHIKKVHLDLR